MSTYTPIASQTLGSSAATVTFSSLPQNYTDLILIVNETRSATSNIYIRFNNDTASNYSLTYIAGNGSAASSGRNSNLTNGYYFDAFGSSSTRGTGIINIMNYTNGATNKTAISRYSNTSSETIATVGLWRNTNPITSVTVFLSGSTTFDSGSTFTIYGVAAGNSSAKASGGNIVTTDGSFWYHTFTSSGTFIPSQALTVDYLVVAGGGGGGGAGAGARGAGGGGAGGLRSTVTASGGTPGTVESALSLSANTVYQAIVGAGGTSAVANKGTNGSNSIFSTITSTGGGAGGAWNTADGIVPNSGGAGGGMPDATNMGTTTGAAGTANQGFKGGDNATTTNGAGSGGGGAGGAGVNIGAAQNDGSAGGAGVAVSITGSSVTYAAGGLGGDAISNRVPSNAVAYTGNGGGGRSGGSGLNNGIGASGGSGIIIVRYAV
jgi:hypothetical protein